MEGIRHTLCIIRTHDITVYNLFGSSECPISIVYN